MAAPQVSIRGLGLDPEDIEILESTGVRADPSGQDGTARSWYAEGHERPQPGRPVAGHGAPDPDEILLLALPPDLLEYAHQALIPLLTQADDTADQGLSDAMEDFRSRLHKALGDLGVPLTADGPVDIIVTPPGSPSTSYNYPERRYMGLHIDQHDGLALEHRHRARRLCVTNIGWSRRHLHVLPRRTADLCRSLGIDPAAEPDMSSHDLTQRYFSRHTDAGVLRIALDPGQAYVFNTQDLPHDGSIPDGDTPGVAFHSMGSWPS